MDTGLDDSSMPWYTHVDYVEAYDYDEFTGQFILRFRDDFDTLDENIWRVSEESNFKVNPLNSSIFTKNHAYVSDGKLVLKLDKEIGPPQPNPEPETVPGHARFFDLFSIFVVQSVVLQLLINV